MTIHSKFGTYVVPTIEAGSDFKPRPAIPYYSPYAFLVNVLACLATLADIAAHQLPGTFDDDPNAAMRGSLALLRLPYDRTAIRDMVAEDWLPTSEWSRDDLIAALEQGEWVGDGCSTQAAPDVLPATRKHNPNLLGQVKTYRSHITVRDNAGNVEGSFDLLRQANEILARNGNKRGDLLTGEIEFLQGEYALIGSQDEAWRQVIEHNPDTSNAITINGKPILLGMVRPMPGVSAGNGKYKSNGGRKGSLAHAAHPRPSYSRITRKNGTLVDPGQVTGSVATIDVGPFKVPYVSTTVVKGYRTSYNGRQLIGHGTWQASTTTRAKRLQTAQTRSAKVLTVTDEQARTVAETMARKLAETPDVACAQLQSFKLQLSNGTLVTVRKAPGKPFKVTVKPIHGKRTETSTTAPRYIGAKVSNLLKR